MAFKDKIRELREQRGLTQRALAQRIGVTTRTLQNYELGKSYPRNQKTVALLCAELETDASYLFSSEDQFLRDAKEIYGTRGANQAQSIISQTSALFSGGELNSDDQEAFMQAITEIYFESKRRSKKYTPSKFRKND